MLPRPDLWRRQPDRVQGQVPRRLRSPAAGRLSTHRTGSVEDLRWFDEVLFDKLVPADEVAAIIVEPIQGEGGYIVPEDGFLEGLRRICDRHGILLIADEIQSGAGRTGKMWAVEHWGVEPDILLTAKGIASGMPLGALVARARLLESWGPGAHGSTYGGNPVACAAALATIDLLEGGLVDNAAARGEQAMAGLRRLAAPAPGLITDVRGKGLMIGIEFDTPDHAEEVQWACFQRGLLVLECGKSSVRMSPALIVREAEIDDRRCASSARRSTRSIGQPEAIQAEAREAGAITGVEARGLTALRLGYPSPDPVRPAGSGPLTRVVPSFRSFPAGDDVGVIRQTGRLPQLLMERLRRSRAIMPSDRSPPARIDGFDVPFG